MVAVNCHINECNTPFMVFPSRVGIKKYCSKECGKKGRDTKYEIECELRGCSNKIVIYPFQKGIRKYCSDACRIEASKGIRTSTSTEFKKGHPPSRPRKVARTEIKCGHPKCKNKFSIRVTQEKKFCSKKCWETSPQKKRYFSELHSGRLMSEEQKEQIRLTLKEKYATGELVSPLKGKTKKNGLYPDGTGYQIGHPYCGKEEYNFKKGHIAWNKGLTKETDDRIATYSTKMAETKKELFRMGVLKPSRYWLGKKQSEESKRKNSETHKKKWQDEKFAKMMSEKFRRSPNMTELRLLDFLDFLHPQKFKYVGDGKLWISGKNPDYIDAENNLIIELFGNYWHEKKEEKERIKYLENCGYNTLVIWENEFNEYMYGKKSTTLIDKIDNFCSN